MRTIAVCNRKGGVGKTTTSACLAALLTGMGARVLCLDTDGQPFNLSVIAGADPARRGMWELLCEESEPTPGSVRACVQPAGPIGDMVAADTSIEAADSALDRRIAREQVLARALAQVEGDYDYAVVDTPPSLWNRTLAALVAADDVIVPTAAVADGTGSVAGVISTLAKLRRALGAAAPREMEVAGVLVTDWLAANETRARDAQLRELCAAQGVRVLETRVRHTVRVPTAAGAGGPVVSLDPQATASQDYARALAEYLALPGRDWRAPDFRGRARNGW